MSIKFSVTSNTPSDVLKAVGTAVGVIVPLSLAAAADGVWTQTEALGIAGAFVLSVLASLGLYHSSAEVPPVVPPGVLGVHTDSEGNTVNG